MTLHRPTVAEQVECLDARLAAIEQARSELRPKDRHLRAVYAQRRGELEAERQRLTPQP